MLLCVLRQHATAARRFKPTRRKVTTMFRRPMRLTLLVGVAFAIVAALPSAVAFAAGTPLGQSGSVASHGHTASESRVGYSCRRGWRLVHRGRGYACRRRSRYRPPQCRSGRVRASRGAGWICRPSGNPASPNPTPPSSPPASPPPPSTPPRVQAMLNAAYGFAVDSGRGSSTGDPQSDYYQYSVPANECVVISGDTARCWLYLWKQSRNTDVDFNTLITRAIYRSGVFAIDLGNGNYAKRVVTELFTPYGIVCSDYYVGFPRCT
jgi:hypothetical protein